MYLEFGVIVAITAFAWLAGALYGRKKEGNECAARIALLKEEHEARISMLKNERNDLRKELGLSSKSYD